MADKMMIGLEKIPEAPKFDELHYVLILDRSDSMKKIKAETISNFNEVISDIRKTAEENKIAALVTVVMFNSTVEILQERVHADNIVALSNDNFICESMTALCDAIFEAVRVIEPHIKSGAQVLMSIFTDGEENRSRKHTKKETAELIKAKQAEGWTITFLGANVDVDKIAEEFAMDASNTLAFTASSKGVSDGMTSYKMSSNRWTNARSSGKNSNTNFYDDDPLADLMKKAALITTDKSDDSQA